MGQLPLDFPLIEDFTLERFKVGHNTELVELLGDAVNVWIYGAAGVGKTHLLQAVCRGREFGKSTFVPALEIADSRFDLSGYESFESIFVDDVQAWIGSRHAEEQLFGLIESMKASGGNLIVSGGDKPPTAIDFVIPDLASRLRSFACYELRALPADELRSFFLETAKHRGLKLPDDVVDYLLLRVGRSHGDLLEVLEKLDSTSLIQAREITIPFAREVLGL